MYTRSLTNNHLSQCSIANTREVISLSTHIEIVVWVGHTPPAAIKHENHPVSTVDDLIHTLNRAMVFLKLGFRVGYHQLTVTVLQDVATFPHFPHTKVFINIPDWILALILPVKFFRKSLLNKFITFQECWTSVMMSLFSEKNTSKT